MIVSLTFGGLSGLALAGLRMRLLRREVSRLATGSGAPSLSVLASALGGRLLPFAVIGVLLVAWSAVAAVAALCAYWVARTLLILGGAVHWRQRG
jgi:hypothetical protein